MYPRLAGIVYQLAHNSETFDKAKQRQVKATFDAMADSGLVKGTNEQRVLPTLIEVPQILIWRPYPGEAWATPTTVLSTPYKSSQMVLPAGRNGTEKRMAFVLVLYLTMISLILVKNVNEVIDEEIF